MRDYFKPGDNNAICMQCGFKFKGSELMKRWDGIFTCSECWEPRQPQDFVRGVVDKMKPAIISSEPADLFIAFCTPEGSSSVAGRSVAGCWISGKPYTGSM